MRPKSALDPHIWLLLTAALSLLAGCASPPLQPAPNRAAVWGKVTLVPAAGLDSGGDSAYGDRRLRGAKLVDYSHPGFVVVYAEGAADPVLQSIELTIRDAAAGARIEPEHSAFLAGGTVVVRNQSEEARLVSCPSQQIIRRLEPGGQLEVRLPESGEHSFHLLEARDSTSQIFASPGPFTVVERSGRFALGDLEPGPTHLGVWHPRFAPRGADVDLVAGTTLKLEFELGPGARQETRLATP
jgi:hypothetical protein